MQAGSQPVASTSATPASQPSHLIDEHALFGSSPSPTNNGNNVDLPPPSRNASGASLLGSPPSKAQRREQIFLARIHDFFVRTGREEVANVMARTLPELAIKRNAATRKPQRQPTLEDDAAAEGGKTTNGPDTSSTMVDPLFEAGDNAQTPFSSPPSATQSPILMPNDYANGDGSKGYLWDWYNIVEDEADRAKTMVAERVAASMNSGQRLLQQQQMPMPYAQMPMSLPPNLSSQAQLARQATANAQAQQAAAMQAAQYGHGYASAPNAGDRRASFAQQGNVAMPMSAPPAARPLPAQAQHAYFAGVTAQQLQLATQQADAQRLAAAQMQTRPNSAMQQRAISPMPQQKRIRPAPAAAAQDVMMPQQRQQAHAIAMQQQAAAQHAQAMQQQAQAQLAGQPMANDDAYRRALSAHQHHQHNQQMNQQRALALAVQQHAPPDLQTIPGGVQGQPTAAQLAQFQRTQQANAAFAAHQAQQIKMQSQTALGAAAQYSSPTPIAPHPSPRIQQQQQQPPPVSQQHRGQKRLAASTMTADPAPKRGRTGAVSAASGGQRAGPIGRAESPSNVATPTPAPAGDVQVESNPDYLNGYAGRYDVEQGGDLRTLDHSGAQRPAPPVEHTSGLPPLPAELADIVAAHSSHAHSGSIDFSNHDWMNFLNLDEAASVA